MFFTVTITILQACLSTVFAIIIGLPAAYLTTHKKFPFKKVLLSLSVVPFCMPPILIVLSFVLFYGRNGLLNRLLMQIFTISEPPVTFLYSFWGIVFTQGLYNFPLAMRMVNDVWRTFSNDIENSARMEGATEMRIFFNITLYRLLPIIRGAGLLIFLYCFFSFVIILLFGSQTMEVEMYHAIRGTFNIQKAAFFVFIEIFTALFFVVLLAQSEIKHIPESAQYFTNENIQEKKFSSPVSAVFGTVFLISIFVFFCLPLMLTALKANFEHYLQLFMNPRFVKALFNSVFVGIITAFCTSILALFYTFFLKIYAQKSRFLRILPMIPMAISSVAVGFLCIVIFKKGTVFWLITAQTLLIFPLSYRQIISYADRIPHSFFENAVINAAKKSHIFYHIFLPLCKNGIINSFFFAFSLSLGDATLPLVLAIPQFDTLSLTVYRLASAYRFEQACAAGIILLAISAIPLQRLR